MTQSSGDLEALIAAHNLRELRVLAGQMQEQMFAKTGFRQTNVSQAGEACGHEAFDPSTTPNRWAAD